MIYALNNTEISLPDIRDYLFVPSKSADKYLDLIDLEPLVYEIEDQLSGPTCVMNVLASECEGRAKVNGVDIDLSRAFGYAGTLASIGNLDQQGLSPRDALRFISKYGLCLENGPLGYPYDVNLLNVKPPDWAFVEAAKMKVLRYEAVIPPSSSMDSIAQINQVRGSLNDGLTVGIAMPVTASIGNLTGPWQTHRYQPVGPTSPMIGRHMVRIIGNDHHAQMFKAQNSWGPDYGDHGYFGIPYSAFGVPFLEAWAVRNFNGWEVPEVPGIKLEVLNKFAVSARIVAEPDEMGKLVNVWMGVMTPDGKVFLRNAAGDFHPRVGNEYPPTLTGLVLGDDNMITVWSPKFAPDGFTLIDLSQYAGTDVYLAYGQSPLDWKLTKICTIPIFN